MQQQGKQNRFKRPGVLLVLLSLMGLLYAWGVSANTTPPDSPLIDNQVNAVAETVVSGSPINTPPPAPATTGSGNSGNTAAAVLPPGITDFAKQLISQMSELVESFQNQFAQTDFYGTGIEASKAMVTRHFTNYCAGSETGNCPQDPLLQFGDIKFTSVVVGGAYLNDAQAQAAQDYLTNLFVPPTGALVPNLQGDLKGGQLDIATIINNPDLLKKYTGALSTEALLSIPRQSFAVMMAKRTVPGSEAGGQSEMQLMEAEAVGRFMSASWKQKMQDPKTAASDVQAEIAMMLAFQNWMALQQYRQMERVEALLAARVVQSVRSGSLLSGIPSGPSATAVSNATGAISP